MRRSIAAAFGVVIVAIAIGVTGAAVIGVAVSDSASADADVAESNQLESDRGPSDDVRTITVAGAGDSSAAPDEAVVEVAVVAEGDDPAAVRDQLRDGADALRASLADAGVGDDRLETTEYRIHEVRREPYEDEPAPADATDYRGVHAVQVTLDDVERTGAVVDATADAGAEVRWVAFTLSEERRADLRDEALRDAMTDASRQAKTLAAASDLRITGVRSVDAADRHGYPVVYEDVVEDADEGTTVLEPRDVTHRATVRVTYDAAEAEGTEE